MTCFEYYGILFYNWNAETYYLWYAEEKVLELLHMFTVLFLLTQFCNNLTLLIL